MGRSICADLKGSENKKGREKSGDEHTIVFSRNETVLQK